MTESYLDGLLDELVPAGSREGWDDVLHRARRSQRRYVVLGVVVAVLVLAPATWAALKAFEGTPPPRPVRRTFALAQKLGRDFPQAEVKKAHGVLQVRTKAGPYDIWAAPSTTGGTCFITGLERDMKWGLQFGGIEACTQRNEPPIIAETDATEYAKAHASHAVFVLFGYATGRESTVHVTMTNGRQMTLPVVEHFFLAALPEPWAIASITGLDATGKAVAYCNPGTKGGKPCGY